MNKFCTALAIGAALYGAAAGARAASCSAHSPAHSIALVELYTSEGCDSCPPADRYLSSLRGAGIGPQQAVLLSLHVDYWNYIGWKDPFSRREFTERQRWMSDLARSRTIYTPEFFVAGRELRSWAGGTPAAVKRINDTAARADIGIALGAPSPDGLRIDVKASSSYRGRLYVALVESALASEVKSGENRGRTLRHDFVVREWLAPQALAAQQGATKQAATVSRMLALPPGARPENLAVTAFVQDERGEVLQAFALPVCGA